jgi:riboflavin synthase
MFTGLVQDLGEVVEVEQTGDGAGLRIRTPLVAEVGLGDSVAVNGVCLTATTVADGAFTAEAMHETLRRSSLGGVEAGGRVNLELAMRAGDRLGGHIVQGHVDGTGTVAAIREDGFARVVTVAAAPDVLRYVVEKGSITVDGVSLTVARVDDEGFDVSLIPETLERTNLGGTEVGRTVNLEVDVIAKYVEKLTAGYAR